MGKPNEIWITRVYDAPVEAVWDAWTDPEQVALWWGPRGFTLTTHSKDLRVGGSWRYTMHGPDGTDYPNVTKYFEVEERAKLVYDHGGSDDRPPLFRVSVTFAEVDGGKTRMDMCSTVATAEIAAELRKFIRTAGGESTWDRLGEYLDKETKGKETFVFNRSFDVPLELMYEMWTDAAHFAKWLPPKDLTMEFLQADIREGGVARYVMTDGVGLTFHGRLLYKALERPGLIVYAQEFCDEKGNTARHPLAPLWPETMLTTVRLGAEGPAGTRVSIHWEPHGKVTQAEMAAFVAERAGMTAGWSGSFEKLEALLVARAGLTGSGSSPSR